MLKVTDTELRQFAVFRSRSANMQGFCLFFAGCFVSTVCSILTLPPLVNILEYGRLILYVLLIVFPLLAIMTGWLWWNEAKASTAEFNALMQSVDAKK